jgi:fibronectin-binding autotransporter adhesin
MRFRLIPALFLAVAVAQPVYAQTYTWTGGGGNGNWNTAANWTGGTPASASNTIIELNNTTQTTTTQNIATPFTLNQLNMLVDASNGFTVTGGALRFAGSGAQISSAAAATLRVDSAIDFAANTTIDLTANNVSGRELQLTGPLTAAAGTTVTVTSSNGTPATITVLQGTNAGFLGTLAVTNNTIVHTTGANTLARSAAVSTTGGQSVYTVGTLAASGLTATGANVQLGAFTGSGQLSLGDNTITSGALVGFNNNVLDTVSGTVAVGNTASHLGKVGIGEWRFTGTTNSTVNGGFSVRDGLVNFTGSSATSGGFGTTSTGTVQVYAGGELRLSLTGTGANGRLGNTQPVTLSGGTLRLDGSGFGASASGFSEVAGALTVGAGQSTIRIDTSATRGARFNFASLANTSSTGSVTFLSNSLGESVLNTVGSGNVNFASAPTAQLVGTSTTYAAASTNLAILPYGTGGTVAAGAGTTFVTYDGTTGSVRGLADTNYASTFGTATDNVSLNANANGAGQTANALRITSGGSVTNAGTLTLTSGALLNNGGGDITGAGTLSFGAGGASTAYVTTNGAFNVSNTISAAHLSKNGAGNLTLTGPVNLGTSGTVAVNAGTLTLGSGATVTNAAAYQVSRGATLDVSANGLAVGTGQTLRGNGTVSGNVTVNSGGLLAPSALAGTGANLASPGTLAVNGNLILNGGGQFDWSVSSVLGGPYTQSQVNVSGTVDLTGLSAANKFIVRPTSLQLSNGGAGNVYDFNSSNSYTWTLITSNNITGFSADKFDLTQLGGFGNDLNGGTLSLQQAGNTLVLTFIPVPEPASMLAVGVVGLAAASWLRRRRTTAAVSHGGIEGLPLAGLSDLGQSPVLEVDADGIEPALLVNA